MKKQTYAIVALIAGIIGIVGSFIPGVVYVAWAGPVVGLIFAILGKKQPDDGIPSTNGMLTAGLVLSIISLALSVACTACAICAACGLSSLATSLGSY
ncbi:MAG: hypothetical protein LBM59_01600 [Ruminococcus sp.]|jgi:hypothetical protein|nr:hypothetical protein [Ruminococcus sp.]